MMWPDFLSLRSKSLIHDGLEPESERAEVDLAGDCVSLRGPRRKVAQRSSTIVGESMTDTSRFDHLIRLRERFGMAGSLVPCGVRHLVERRAGPSRVAEMNPKHKVIP